MQGIFLGLNHVSGEQEEDRVPAAAGDQPGLFRDRPRPQASHQGCTFIFNIYLGYLSFEAVGSQNHYQSNDRTGAATFEMFAEENRGGHTRTHTSWPIVTLFIICIYDI